MDDIYREELMDIYKNPSRKGKLKSPTVTVSKNNPLCGDEINVYLDIKNGFIRDARFDGSACAVSVISSSKLLDSVVGKSVKDVKNLSEEEFLKFLGLNLTTSREKCATLVLSALEKAFKEYEEKN